MDKQELSNALNIVIAVLGMCLTYHLAILLLAFHLGKDAYKSKSMPNFKLAIGLVYNSYRDFLPSLKL
jgi:hypothetical protein